MNGWQNVNSSNGAQLKAFFYDYKPIFILPLTEFTNYRDAANYAASLAVSIYNETRSSNRAQTDSHAAYMTYRGSSASAAAASAASAAAASSSYNVNFESQPHNAAAAAAAAKLEASPSRCRASGPEPGSQSRADPKTAPRSVELRKNTSDVKLIKAAYDSAQAAAQAAAAQAAAVKGKNSLKTIAEKKYKSAQAYANFLENAYDRYINFNPSFAGILDIVQERAEGFSNQSQMDACYKWQIDNPVICSEGGLYRDPNMYKTCDYLTGIHFGNREGPIIEGEKTAILFDNTIVWRKTNIQLEAEHLASMNGMIACFGNPSGTFFSGTSTPRKKLIALCAMAGSMKITNAVKSNQLLQTLTIEEDEVIMAFDKCKTLLKSVHNSPKKTQLIARLDEKKKEKCAFKPNEIMIDWLINSFYTGTDTVKGSSIRFIDFPFSICMDMDGIPHEQFVRCFAQKYCGMATGENLNTEVKQKHKTFINNTKLLILSQVQHLCDILNMYVTIPELIMRCVNIQTGNGTQLDPGGGFFSDFDNYGELIVECINFPIKADTLYSEIAEASRNFGAAAAIAHKERLKAAARARRLARGGGEDGEVEALLFKNLSSFESKAKNFFVFFKRKYNTVLSKINGKGASDLRFKIHSGYFILKKQQWLRINAAPAIAAPAAAAAAAVAAVNDEDEEFSDGDEEFKKAALLAFNADDFSQVSEFIGCTDENKNPLLIAQLDENTTTSNQRQHADDNRTHNEQTRVEFDEALEAERTVEREIEDEAQTTEMVRRRKRRNQLNRLSDIDPEHNLTGFGGGGGQPSVNKRLTVGGLSAAARPPPGYELGYYVNEYGETKRIFTKTSDNRITLRTRKRNQRRRKTRKV